MANMIDKEAWREFIDKFSSYEGTVTKYCLENNLSKSQFYYHKRRFDQPAEAIFQAISFEKEKYLTINNESAASNDIRIELGKANIFIPANEIALLSNIIKELAKSC
jgi:hypothetical protein